MEQSDIDRINVLARKARTEGLTEAEKAEQAELRKAYIAAYRQSLISTLDRVVIAEPDGTTHKLKKKPQQE